MKRAAQRVDATPATGSRAIDRSHAYAQTVWQVDPNAALFRLPAASTFSGLSRSVLYRLVDQGKLKKINVGRASLICGDSLRALIADLRASA